MAYSTYDFKMAENNSWNRENLNFRTGRARVLIDALTYFENRRNRGRAGMTPPNFNSTHNFEENRWGEHGAWFSMCESLGIDSNGNTSWGPFFMEGKR